jgi:hypothetical protein
MAKETRGTQAETQALKALRALPGVGPSIARDLYDLGFRKPEDLRGADPEALYERSCALQGIRIDRCLLYVYRCAVHVAEHPDADETRRKWWNWKDECPTRPGPSRGSRRSS